MSKFYEKEFLEYLIKNNIESELAKRELECFYTSLFNNAEDLLLLTNLEDELEYKGDKYDFDAFITYLDSLNLVVGKYIK